MDERVWKVENQGISSLSGALDSKGFGYNGLSVWTNYISCARCGQIYPATYLHQCPRQQGSQEQTQWLADYAKVVMQPVLQSPKETKMTKDTLILINESGITTDSTDKGLEVAKESARAYSNKNKCRVFITKPIWSCAPKTDLVESDL